MEKHSTMKKRRGDGGYLTPLLGIDAHNASSISRVDKLVELAKYEIDSETRQEYYDEIHELVADNQPYIYIFQPKEFRPWRAGLKGSGLEYHPIDEIYWYHIYKE